MHNVCVLCDIKELLLVLSGVSMFPYTCIFQLEMYREVCMGQMTGCLNFLLNISRKESKRMDKCHKILIIVEAGL